MNLITNGSKSNKNHSLVNLLYFPDPVVPLVAIRATISLC